jgi:hypothetical protein
MISERQVMVVSPDKYKPLARHLTHVMSQFQGCKAANWSIKQYENNEFQLGGQRYAVFLGDQEENPLTKDYMPLVRMKHTDGGICYGYDGPKAVVFGNGNLDQKENFDSISKAFYAVAAASASAGGVGAGLVTAPLWLITGPGVIVPVTSYLASRLGKYMHKKYKSKGLKHKQIKVAVEMFCKNDIELWLGLNSD